jgi:hypothetical protein
MEIISKSIAEDTCSTDIILLKQRSEDWQLDV